MLEAKDAVVQGEVGRPDWKELSESLERMITELKKEPESTSYLQVLDPIRTQPEFTVGIYDGNSCVPLSSSTYSVALSLDAIDFVDRQTAEFCLTPTKFNTLISKIEENPELTIVLNNIDLYPNSTTGYKYGPARYVSQEALMAPGKIEPKLVPCIEGFDPNLQSFVCNCDVHNGVTINKHHIEQCGHLSWDRYYTPEEELNAVNQGFKQTVHIDIGKKYTTVPVWKTNRRVEGLAQILSNDPIGYAEKQMREATKLPPINRPPFKAEDKWSNDGVNTIPKDDDSHQWISSVQTGLSAEHQLSDGMSKPSPKPFQYHSDKTKFYLVGDKKPWYRQQGFKWYKVAFYAFMTLFAKFFGKSVSGDANKSKVILLTKQQLINRLRMYTQIPYISSNDRQYINAVVFNAFRVREARAQEILRRTQEWTGYGKF